MHPNPSASGQQQHVHRPSTGHSQGSIATGHAMSRKGGTHSRLTVRTQVDSSLGGAQQQARRGAPLTTLVENRSLESQFGLEGFSWGWDRKRTGSLGFISQFPYFPSSGSPCFFVFVFALLFKLCVFYFLYSLVVLYCSYYSEFEDYTSFVFSCQLFYYSHNHYHYFILFSVSIYFTTSFISPRLPFEFFISFKRAIKIPFFSFFTLS